MMPSYSVAQIADRVGGEVAGAGDRVLSGVEPLDSAGPEHLSFIRDSRRADAWPASRAGAALVTHDIRLDPGNGRSLIRVSDADTALASVLEMFAPPPPRPAPGVHPLAAIDPTARLGQRVAVAAGCTIGRDVRIGDDCVLHPNVTVLDYATLGRECELFPGAVVRDRCELGDRVVIHPNAVIGADGFGYRPSTDPKRPGLVKIPHIGTVRIDSDVEVGAGTCIDRGKFAATIIGEGTKIDDLCLIAHNCRIGRHCAIAGHSALAGSVTVGDGVIMGGGVLVKDHVVIGDGARIAGAAAVADDVPAGAGWAGYPARDAKQAMREFFALRRLPELIKAWRK